MPELPEVETSVQAIQEFANQNLESIEIYNQNLRWKVDTAAFKKLYVKLLFFAFWKQLTTNCDRSIVFKDS